MDHTIDLSVGRYHCSVAGGLGVTTIEEGVLADTISELDMGTYHCCDGGVVRGCSGQFREYRGYHSYGGDIGTHH